MHTLKTFHKPPPPPPPPRSPRRASIFHLDNPHSLPVLNILYQQQQQSAPALYILTLSNLVGSDSARCTPGLPYEGPLAELLQESEGEDAAESRVTLAEDVGRGNLASRQSRVKLQEASCASSA